MTVPEGFRSSSLPASRTCTSRSPCAWTTAAGVWVAEAYSYPIRRPDKEAKDRILIFEDTDGDGVFDKRTVFMEGLNLVSGLEVGFGGVWIGAAPYLMFVPCKTATTGPPDRRKILLDGWGYQDTHETLTPSPGGPDGWLYGCHGVFTHSRVGKPGTPDDKRTPINAGVWRYHPTRHVFEVFAEGTSNPWGFDFNDHGQAFLRSLRDSALFPHHSGRPLPAPGGPAFQPVHLRRHQNHCRSSPLCRRQPARRQRPLRLGRRRPRPLRHDDLPGRRLAGEYRDQMFMGNIHGRRLNVDLLKPKGSGYVGSRTA